MNWWCCDFLKMRVYFVSSELPSVQNYREIRYELIAECRFDVVKPKPIAATLAVALVAYYTLEQVKL